MKKTIPVFAIVLSVVLSACASRKTTPVPSEPDLQLVPEVSTTLPDNSLTPGLDSSNLSEGQSPSVITLEDTGKMFTLHVGDSILLNLGTDVYDWEVTVDNQDVIRMKMGVMVIQGAQGIFDALAPGTATLTAVGSPKCLQSTPPCGMPTILFTVTLVVQ